MTIGLKLARPSCRSKRITQNFVCFFR